MNHSIIFFFALLFPIFLPAQEDLPGLEAYEFANVTSNDATDIKSQQKTGTCWSYSTVSFLESEMMRLGKAPIDLSEMFIVNGIYREKAENYILRQGKTNFSQGALAHDVMHGYEKYGIVPQEAYDGLPPGQQALDHSEMEAALSGMLNGIVKNEGGKYWRSAVDAVLSVYMGQVPESFSYKGKQYTPRQFADNVVGLDPHDYVEITSFTHIPDYRKFVLEVPDNFSSGSYYNVPLDELTLVVNFALENGHTVVWDCDVSEESFSAQRGYAIIPDEDAAPVNGLPAELSVTRSLRQEAYEDFSTTDDHLMHIVGMAEDKNGTPYFIVKNSWGEVGPFEGYLYASVPYFEMKTIGIMVHKDAIPAEIGDKLNL